MHNCSGLRIPSRADPRPARVLGFRFDHQFLVSEVGVHRTPTQTRIRR